MRKSIRHSLAVMAAVLRLGQALGQAQNVIDVDIFNTGEVKAIPVHIEGFTGDVLSLLKFDLFVQGFEFVEQARRSSPSRAATPAAASRARCTTT